VSIKQRVDKAQLRGRGDVVAARLTKQFRVGRRLDKAQLSCHLQMRRAPTQPDTIAAMAAARRSFTTAIGSYPHTRPLKDGSVTSDRLTLEHVEVVPANRAFRPMVNQFAYDISELALVTLMLAKVFRRPLVGVPVVLMHHQGAPETMQDDPRYDDVLVEIFLWLEERIAAAEDAGIKRDKILIDPGFGFGKNVAHNLELMDGLAILHGLGCPIVLGASRKRTIGALSGEAPADQRLPGSLAFALKAVEQGAQIIRVHDVPETVQALRVWRGLRDQALTPRV